MPEPGLLGLHKGDGLRQLVLPCQVDKGGAAKRRLDQAAVIGRGPVEMAKLLDEKRKAVPLQAQRKEIATARAKPPRRRDHRRKRVLSSDIVRPVEVVVVEPVIQRGLVKMRTGMPRTRHGTQQVAEQRAATARAGAEDIGVGHRHGAI